MLTFAEISAHTATMKLIQRALTFLLLIGLLSCQTARNATLYQDAVENNDTTQGYNPVLIRIQPFDILGIKIVAEAKSFSEITTDERSSNQPGLTGYSVDAEGHINLPELGKIFVAGLTLEEVTEILKDKLEETIVNPFVQVRFLSFKINVQGEVLTPGIVVIEAEKATLIEAISLAGGFTETANIKAVKVMRGEINKNPLVYIYDFRTIESFKNSAGFYLQPNDHIYVEPTNRKFFNANVALVFSTLTILNTMLIFYTTVLIK